MINWNLLRLRVAASKFIVSNMDLVVATSLAGIVSAFPSVNLLVPSTPAARDPRIGSEILGAGATSPRSARTMLASSALYRKDRNQTPVAVRKPEVPLTRTNMAHPGEVDDAAHEWGAKVSTTSLPAHAEENRGEIHLLTLVHAGLNQDSLPQPLGMHRLDLPPGLKPRKSIWSVRH